MNALQIMSPNLIKIDWSIVEDNWVKLPQLFKTFHEIFDISTVGNYFMFAYINKNNVETFGFYTHPMIKNIILDTIFQPLDLKKNLFKVLDLDDSIDKETYENNVIPIAYCPGGELLMLGVGDENADKIYYYVRYHDDRLKFIANNIFDFFKEYHIKIDETYLLGIRLEQLYRNWGDKFWSVKEGS